MILQDMKSFRQSLKRALPFVRRRVFRDLERKYTDVVDALHAGLTTAEAAPILVRKAPPALGGEVCLFVTHAPRAVLKTHVVHHIEHLLRVGLHVVLIVNTELPLDRIEVDPELEARLAGVFVRANLGFDFAAWCHVLALCDRSAWTRLYLVNDSVVGPVDAAAFDSMMQRIRASKADITGLTDNQFPVPHLQSFFLVFNEKVLHSDAFERFTRRIFNFTDKAHVVDVYEVRLTRTLRAAGFTAASLFPDLPGLPRIRGDLLGYWEPLVDAGFPFVKTRALQAHTDHPRMRDIRAKAHVDDQI